VGGGLDPLLAGSARLQGSGSPFWALFPSALTASVGYWATLSLNIPDFTRYAKSQRSQMLGQALGLPTTMTLFAFIGVAVTSATIVRFGEAIWDPVVLLGKFNEPAVAIIALVALLIATLNTNVAANVVSPSNDFSNLNPRRISFRTGGLITGVIGVLMMPWRLLSDFSAYIFGWLVGYSGLLGPIAGVMIADLYRRGGEYEYDNGVNPRAVIALVAGIATALLGLVVPPLRLLYDYAWFVGFGVSGGVYVMLMQRAQAPAWETER
jgi:NCS1 family nucleobase:cation symporter-1